MSNLRNDGLAVEVTLTKAVSKGDPVIDDGFHGVAMTDGAIGDVIAIEIAPRVYEFDLGVTAGAKGDVLDIENTDNTLVASGAGDAVFGIVTEAKDANGFAWVKLLENRQKGL